MFGSVYRNMVTAFLRDVKQIWHFEEKQNVSFYKHLSKYFLNGLTATLP
jgi:hypothetical protein